MRQASRTYVQRHARPRDEQGRFLAGRELWTREDGQTRWIHLWQPETHVERRSLSISEDGLRHLAVLCFVIAVAVLLALVVR